MVILMTIKFMELTVNTGKGYVPAEKNREKDLLG